MRAVPTVVAAGSPAPLAWEGGDIVCGPGLLVQGIMLITGTIAGIIGATVNTLMKPIGTILDGGVIGGVSDVLIAVIPTVNRALLSATAMIMAIIVVFIIPLIIAIVMLALTMAIS